MDYKYKKGCILSTVTPVEGRNAKCQCRYTTVEKQGNLKGELLKCETMGKCCSETSGILVKAKLHVDHPWEGGTKVKM